MPQVIYVQIHAVRSGKCCQCQRDVWALRGQVHAGEKMIKQWLAAAVRLARYQPWRVTVAFAAIVIVVVAATVGGPSLGAAWTEILSFFGAAALLAIRLKPDEPPVSENDIAREVLRDVRGQRFDEARTRGWLDRRFVPVVIIGEPMKEAGEPGPASWSTEDFERHATSLWRAAPRRRLIVSGGAGSGKSVISMMLTLGLLDNDAGGGHGESDSAARRVVPLPVSIGSWRPFQEGFDSWLSRRIAVEYPSTRRISYRETGGSLARVLIATGRYLLILDGLDEVTETERADGIRQLQEFFQPGVPVVILTRIVSGLRTAFADARRVTISPVPAEITARYLEELPTVDSISLAELMANLRLGNRGRLRALLGKPLYIDLIESALRNRQLTAGYLADTATAEGVAALEKALIRWRLEVRLRPLSSGGRHRARTLVYFAQQMTRHKTNVLPWWRLADLMPTAALVMSAGLLAAIPSYTVGLRMPLGLTRGLAIGITIAIMYGILRGRTAGWRDLWLLAVSLPAGVCLVGWRMIGWRLGVTDAVEITSAVVLGIRYRDALFGPPFGARPPALPAGPGPGGERRRPPAAALARAVRDLAAGRAADNVWQFLAVLASIGVISGSATSAVAVFTGPSGQALDLPSIAIPVSMGIGVAAAASRLMIVNRERMLPSTVLLRLTPRTGGVMRAYRAGMLSAVAIGLCGGIVGMLRFGPDYGVTLAFVFGCIVGTPVGIVGGAIRYLAAPVRQPEADRGGRPRESHLRGSTPGPSTLQTDRTVAVSSVVSIGVAATAAIAIVTGPWRALPAEIGKFSGPPLVPVDGLLFGATIGAIVACFGTAWPAYAIARAWLFLNGRSPARLETFIAELYRAEILRREGSYVLFRHYDFQEYLSLNGRRFIADFEGVADDQIPSWILMTTGKTAR